MRLANPSIGKYWCPIKTYALFSTYSFSGQPMHQTYRCTKNSRNGLCGHYIAAEKGVASLQVFFHRNIVYGFIGQPTFQV